MGNGNHIDELDNQLEADFDSEAGIDEEAFEPEEVPEDFEGGSSDASDADLTSKGYEGAVRANPKRLTATQREKAQAFIEGFIDDAELSHPEGQQEAWKRLEAKIGSEHARPFKISDAVSANDVIDHPEFGIGFVVELTSPKKVKVLFAQGIKKLACNIS